MLTPNEILDLQLEYKKDKKIINLISDLELFIKDVSNYDEISGDLGISNKNNENLESDVSQLEEDKQELEDTINHLNNVLDSLDDVKNIREMRKILRESGR